MARHGLFEVGVGPIFQRSLTAFLTAAMLLAQVPAGLLPDLISALASAEPVLDQEQSEVDPESWLTIEEEGPQVAQTMIVGTTGRIAGFEVPLWCPDESTLQLSAFHNNGTSPGGNAITGVGADGSIVKGTPTSWFSFMFDDRNPPNHVVAGDGISIQAMVPFGSDCRWYRAPAGDLYTAGNAWTRPSPRGTWVPLSDGGDDMPFRVFIEPEVVEPTPDLVLSITETADAPIVVGEEFSHTLAVANSGTAAATNVELTYELPAGLRFTGWSGSPFGCEIVDDFTLLCTYDSLATSTHGEITASIEALEAGEHSTSASVSSTGADAEPADNTASRSVTVDPPPPAEDTGLPDLVVTSFTATPATVAPGGTATYAWTIKNQGTGTATIIPEPTFGWADQVWLSTSATSVTDPNPPYGAGGIVAPVSLAPGESYTQSFSATIQPGVPLGSYYFILETDSNEQTAESNETNNLSIAVPVTIGTPPPAPATVSAEVREDTNGDGDFDAGDPFVTVPRIDIYRTNVDGVRAEAPSATALNSPNLSLSGVEAGSFDIEYAVPSGYESVSENPVAVSVEAGATSSTVFLVRRIAGLTGFARCGDVTLPGAAVELLSGNALLAATTANADAFYSFAGVAAGATYTIRITGSYWVFADGFEIGVEQFVTCGLEVTVGADGSATAPAGTTIPNRLNHTWTTAFDITEGGSPGVYTETLTDYVFTEGQSTWFRFPVRASQHVTVNVTDLPADYSVTLYKDIQALYDAQLALITDDPLANVDIIDGSVAPDALSPDALSPDALSPDALSPDALSPDALSPDALSPDALSPDALSPDALSPDALSPDALSPDALSPDALSPDALSPEVYASAQMAALIGVSAHVGLSPERIGRNTWSNDGYWYVRVRGHNGAFSPAAPFTLSVATVDSACAGATLPTFPALSPIGGFAGMKAVILTNSARLGSDATFRQKLGTLAAHSRVRGAVVDLAGLADGAYAQWDAASLCPAAANVIAHGIRDLVGAYRAQYPTIEHVVLVGGDTVIPFFRTPDQSGLGNERDYSPPVADDSASQASLKLGYVLTQDPYGAGTPFSRFDHELYVPELGVGRLVETPAQIAPVIDAFLATNGVIAPQRALVTGYDFLSDAALAIADDLVRGGLTTDQDLVQPVGDGPNDPTAWTAEQLRAKLLSGPRAEIVALNGHFSANRALAADYATRFGSEEIAAVTDGRFFGTLVLSTGCHSGYNIIDGHAVPLTQPLDFPQAFALQGATLVGGTGYQYGDTDFIKYSELIHANLVRELRYGDGPVDIGTALTRAKRAYISQLAALRGIDEKAIAEATLYGLPMTAVDLPAAGLAAAGLSVSALGAPAGTFSSSTWSPTYTLDRNEVTLTSTDDPNATSTAIYYDIDGNVSVSPGTPVLPLLTRNVESAGKAARGVVLLDAQYQDEHGVLPLTSVATTEVRGAHAPYTAEVFTPVRPLTLNHFAGTTLVTTPFQFRSNAAGTSGTARTITEPTYKIYYSSSTDPDVILASSPVVYAVHLTEVAGGVRVDVIAGAADSVGIEEIFATYTGETGALYGSWDSVALTAGTTTTVTGAAGSVTTYSATIPTADPDALRVLVQAVAGNGLVNWATNNGAYYRVVEETATTAVPKAATELVLSAPSSGTYLGTASVSAVLTSAGAPLAHKTVAFRSGDARIDVVTDANGRAAAALPLTAAPGVAAVSVGFEEDAAYLAAGDEDTITIHRASTSFAAVATISPIPLGGSAVVGTLRAAGQGLGGQPVTIAGAGHTVASFTDGYGRVRFDTAEGFPAGAYEVVVTYAGNDRYQAAASLKAFVAIYDVNASVTAGGWILTGGKRTNFGLTVKYKDGAPKGNLELHARDAGRVFRADAFAWLAAGGGVATLEGDGTWDGVSGHRFRARLMDAASDRFEISIWDAGGTLVYGAAADLGGGSVTVR